MRLKVTSTKDLWSGVLFLAIAVIAGAMALRYPTGTLSRMGPGFFPLALSGILALTGAVLLARSFIVVEPGATGFRPAAVLCVLGGAALFAGFVDVLGLALTSALLIVVTFLGGWESSWGRMLALAAGMAAFVVILFVLLLNMQLRIWPALWS
jgi:hypothetical protein